jgi:hypothetical protein
MRAAPLVLLALLALPGAGGLRAAEDPALVALEACRARLDPRRDVGLARIEKRCPELLPALERAAWSPLLPQGMRERRDEVSADSLRELGELVRGLRGAAATRAAPDPARLAPVLAELGEQGQQGATRWERFKRWLQDKLERREKEESDEKSLLADLGEEFETSEGVARLITYTGYGLLALLVLFVVWSELRAAGLLGGPPREGARAAEAAAWRRRLQLADVLDAPLAERPGLLLKLLGETLTRAHRLPAANGLTASALVRRARLDSDAERAELEQLATAAEAVRYAPRAPEPERLEGAVTAARSLLDKFARLTPRRGG